MVREWIGFFTFLMYLVSTLYNMRLMVYMEKAGFTELSLSAVFVLLLLVYLTMSIKQKQCVVCGRLTSLMIVLLLINTFEFAYFNMIYPGDTMMHFTIRLLLTICTASIYGFTYLISMNTILIMSLVFGIVVISWLVSSRKQMVSRDSLMTQ